jgi:hypothetical protein
MRPTANQSAAHPNSQAAPEGQRRLSVPAMTHAFSPLHLRRALIKIVLYPDDGSGMVPPWSVIRAANVATKATVRWSRNLDAAFEAVVAELTKRPVQPRFLRTFINDYRATAGLTREKRRWTIRDAINAIAIDMHMELMEQASTAHGRMRLMTELHRLEIGGEDP